MRYNKIIYHVINLGNHILQNRIGINLIYISFEVSFCNFVMSYLRYLCSFAFICGIQLMLSFFFPQSCLPYVPNFSGLSIFLLSLRYSLTFICIDCIYLYTFTDTRQTTFAFMITVISYFFTIVIEYYCLLNKYIILYCHDISYICFFIQAI